CTADADRAVFADFYRSVADLDFAVLPHDRVSVTGGQHAVTAAEESTVAGIAIALGRLDHEEPVPFESHVEVPPGRGDQPRPHIQLPVSTHHVDGRVEIPAELTAFDGADRLLLGLVSGCADIREIRCDAVDVLELDRHAAQ